MLVNVRVRLSALFYVVRVYFISTLLPARALRPLAEQPASEAALAVGEGGARAFKLLLDKSEWLAGEVDGIRAVTWELLFGLRQEVIFTCSVEFASLGIIAVVADSIRLAALFLDCFCSFPAAEVLFLLAQISTSQAKRGATRGNVRKLADLSCFAVLAVDHD